MLLTCLRLAIKALSVHKLRTALTMLGMTIGVAAVITMISLGTGARQTVSQDIQSAGTTLITVRAGNFTRGGEESNIPSGLGSAKTLTPADADVIRRIPGVKYAASGIKMRSWINAGQQKEYSATLGTDVKYPLLNMWTFSHGKFFDGRAVSSNLAVVVLGQGLSDKLFGPDTDPTGQQVQIQGQNFRVLGVASTSDDDQGDMAYMPYTSLSKLLGVNYLQTISVSVERAGDATTVSDQIKSVLRTRHQKAVGEAYARARQSGMLGSQMPTSGTVMPDDFTVKTQAAEALTKGLYTSVAAFVLANMPKVDEVNLQEMAGTLNRAGATMTALLVAIATISLVVGGIGIMNIMLVSVTERTREIGIRRSVGARKRDVLLQFLVEAVTLSLIGGSIGICFGFLLSLIVTKIFEWPTSVPPSAIALAFGIAGAVGVFFGFYPARRASQLDPIEALRYE